MHVVAHERGTAALPRQVTLRTWLDRLVADAADLQRDGAPVLADEGAQAALADALIQIEVLRHHATRTMSSFLNGGAVGPESSGVKLLMAQAEQTLGMTALEVLGDEASRRVLARAVSLLPRRERLRRHPADPARHHRRPRPLPSQGVTWTSR